MSIKESLAPANAPLIDPPVRLTELRESPRRPGRYVLQLSDGRNLVVGIGVLSDTGATRTGMELAPHVVERLVHESVITDLTDRAMDMLARGRRTRRELEQRLRRREANPGQIREALDRLEASGVLSDEAVAGAEASARLRRGEAPARVTQQLRRKGVAGRVAAEAVAEAVEADDFDEASACQAVAVKRARSLAGLEPEVAMRRLLAFLLRRGYGGQIARQAAKEALLHSGNGDEFSPDVAPDVADEIDD
ncbi:MAG: RecX family transcriptional regulator [Gemmatimonadaceae bacterium]|nr:RecX family transcriptional regulator [Gemmatimonadaceae bacterium]